MEIHGFHKTLRSKCPIEVSLCYYSYFFFFFAVEQYHLKSITWLIVPFTSVMNNTFLLNALVSLSLQWSSQWDGYSNLTGGGWKWDLLYFSSLISVTLQISSHTVPLSSYLASAMEDLSHSVSSGRLKLHQLTSAFSGVYANGILLLNHEIRCSFLQPDLHKSIEWDKVTCPQVEKKGLSTIHP